MGKTRTRAEHLPKGALIYHWKVIKKLGEGSFGAVYRVEHTKSHEKCAMKVESVEEADSAILMEVAVLKTFRESGRPCPHVLDYVDSGATSFLRFVVMKLAGPNLSDVRRSCSHGRFTEMTTVRLGIQCIRSIEALHSIGFLHRDIKPPNYAIGTGHDQRNVYLLDFGLARQYTDKSGHVRPPRHRVGFRGTARYASINAHLRRDLGRHDDLWSLLYMLIELQQGKLPWKSVGGKEEVGEAKRKTVADVLLRGMAFEFHEILNELQGLQYYDRPNYDWFCERLDMIMRRYKYRYDAPYDWEAGNDTLKKIKKALFSGNPFRRQKKGAKKAEKERHDGDDGSRLSGDESKQ